jgi:hypothetical protein
MRIVQVTTKSMHPDLLPSKQVISTFREADYDLEIDFAVRRAVHIAAKPGRRGEYFKAPFWVPIEDVKDWHEDETGTPTLVPSVPGPTLAKGKASAA